MNQTELSPLEKQIAKKIKNIKPKKLQRGYARELVFKLHDTIEDALARGCEYDDVAKSMNESRMEISASALKRYHVDNRRLLKNEKTENKSRTVDSTINTEQPKEKNKKFNSKSVQLKKGHE